MRNIQNKDFMGKQAKAHAMKIKVSPRKLGLVAGLIRRLSVADALIQLTFSKKRVAAEVKKCLQSAIANAENNHYMDVVSLYVHEVMVGKALVMKRMMPRARGRSTRIDKPFSNISITVRQYEDN